MTSSVACTPYCISERLRYVDLEMAKSQIASDIRKIWDAASLSIEASGHPIEIRVSRTVKHHVHIGITLYTWGDRLWSGAVTVPHADIVAGTYEAIRMSLGPRIAMSAIEHHRQMLYKWFY